MSVRGSSGLKQLVGTTRDQVIDLPREFHEWIVWNDLEHFWRPHNFSRGLIFHACFSFLESL
jgi:hypothetical protein